MEYSASYFIEKFQLAEHPEGGYFREVYRSEEKVLRQGLPQRFTGDRNLSTSIYFLLECHQFSAFHRIKSDELWHFYYGSPLTVYVIHPSGDLEKIKLGNDPENGCTFQAVVKAGCWFASQPETQFSLVGCTVAPGFDFEDFEMAEKRKLREQFPQHFELINRLSQ
ncbi:hypothetical protein GS399_11880 [Pedobacter sp. HMF7647]|uniref:DUF985 domain-containing protein n=1 Tax=Hufsiella arboris TaxID=2695275 RepID=A0A7K1YAR3_9SPHI|nr:cupin domain-containing protein [Hufsiella arboris]MXV51673.1 hypothetical protein [Hufsiella arboris]